MRIGVYLRICAHILEDLIKENTIPTRSEFIYLNIEETSRKAENYAKAHAIENVPKRNGAEVPG